MCIMSLPEVVVLLSGKRKSGKDFIAEKLVSIFGDEDCGIIRISEPIKRYYAKENNLDLKELMSDNPYKEIYRKNMILWSDEVRLREPGYFCKAACTKANIKKIWIVSDIRRKTDIKWFIDEYGDKVKTIRIVADMNVRELRGWVFTSGVDDVASECDLDDYTNWDLEVNNSDTEKITELVTKLSQFILSFCK